MTILAIATGTGVIAANLLFAFPAHAASERVIYTFTGVVGDGQNPADSLVNVGGTLYGTTYYGGGGLGAVFSVTTAGAETVLYGFQGGSDGETPLAGLISVGGTLYGTTDYGGGSANCPEGCGTVFSVTTAGAEKVLYAFKAGRDGSTPYAGLVAVGAKLYGTTYYGGAGGGGTAFRVTTAGAEKVLYSFQGGPYGGPTSGLINVGGTLYGTTYGGGANGLGTVFSLTPAGTVTILYSFQGGSDGENPWAGLTNVGGTLYGTTLFGGGSASCDGGCGTVFQVTTAGAEKVVYEFQGGTDGASPWAGLLNVNGKLWGTTKQGGGSANCAGSCGTVFRVTTAGAEKIEHSFTSGSDGANPLAGLIKVGGTLYGTTYGGGSANCTGGCGTVYAVTP